MSDKTQPVSSGPQTSAVARAAVFLFFGAFLAMGSALGIGIVGKPLVYILSARHWQSASCEIISSSVQANPGSDGGSTYRVDVTYRYFVDDRGYVGDRYQFMEWSTGGSRGKAAIVARLRPGTRTECWVNPDNPSDAVIERGLTADLWLGLILLPFLIIGGGGIYFTAVGRQLFSGLASGRPTTTGATYMLHGCETSPDLLHSLAASLGEPLSTRECGELHARHDGNLRAALRELYDRWTIGGMNAE